MIEWKGIEIMSWVGWVLLGFGVLGLILLLWCLLMASGNGEEEPEKKDDDSSWF